MTTEDKNNLLKDYKEWSGGSTPDECTTDDIDTYMDLAISVDVDEYEAKIFLIDYPNN